MLDRVETVGCPLTNGDEILPTTASVLSDISSTGGGGGASKGSGGGGGGIDDSAGGRGGRSSVPVARNKKREMTITRSFAPAFLIYVHFTAVLVRSTA